MPITAEENNKYLQFVGNIAKEYGTIVDPSSDEIVWHYTNGEGLLGILQSSSLYATQVSALNDSKETDYASDLFKKAVKDLIGEKVEAGDYSAVKFLDAVLEMVKDEPENPTRGTSKFFVTCFSAETDDLNQWVKYGKAETGFGRYALGFYKRGLNRGLNSVLFRVVYDREKQEKAAKELALATLNFYREGLTPERMKDPEQWAKDFYLAWDEWIYRLAPVAKDPKWKSENEYRIVHELTLSEFAKVRFAQRKTTLARYIPLDFPCWVPRRGPLLPLAKVMIGPGCKHPSFTAVSTRLLLSQMGYPDTVTIEKSECSLEDI